MFETFSCYISKEMDEEVLRMQTDEIVSRARLLDNEIKVRFFMFSDLCYRPHWKFVVVAFLKLYCGELLYTVSCLSDISVQLMTNT